MQMSDQIRSMEIWRGEDPCAQIGRWFSKVGLQASLHSPARHYTHTRYINNTLLYFYVFSTLSSSSSCTEVERCTRGSSVGRYVLFGSDIVCDTVIGNCLGWSRRLLAHKPCAGPIMQRSTARAERLSHNKIPHKKRKAMAGVARRYFFFFLCAHSHSAREGQ